MKRLSETLKPLWLSFKGRNKRIELSFKALMTGLLHNSMAVICSGLTLGQFSFLYFQANN